MRLNNTGLATDSFTGEDTEGATVAYSGAFTGQATSG